MADKTALVVGASRGLGLGLAKELASRGWTVIGTRRGPASDKGLQELADQSGGKVRVEALDLEDAKAIEALPARLDGETLDLLFVNAGISGTHGLAGAHSQEEVGQVFLTNSVAPVHVAEALAGRVRPDTGVIAFMSSGLGSITNSYASGMDLYSASKAALNRMAKGFAEGEAAKQLTVLLMSPGWVRTDMGGPEAPLSIEESCKAVVDVLEAQAGSHKLGFYGHDGHVIPW